MNNFLLMLAYSKAFLLGLVCGLLLWPTAQALAQPAAGRHVVSYKTIAVSELDFLLEQCVLDAAGHTQRPLMRLPPRFGLEAAATSGTRNLYLLRKAYTDTVQLLLTDSLGRMLHQPRQFMQRMGERFSQKAQLMGLPNGKGFIMTHPTGKGGHPEINIVCLGPDLAVRWKQQVVNKEFTWVEQFTVNDSHVWVNLLQYIGGDRQPQVWVARLATGEVMGNVLLTPTEEIESAVLVPAGLLLLGTAHRNYLPKPTDGRPEPASRRCDVVRLITADGQQPLLRTLSWPAPGRPHYYWKTARSLPGGGYELVGETYREVLNGGTLALAMLGGGMVGFANHGFIPISGYVNQVPAGLVVARMGPGGELTNVREAAVPEAMHMSPADSTSALPKGRPTSYRVRGLSADNQYVVLNTTRQVLLYSLASGRLQPLLPARRTTPTVLGTEPGFINVGWTLVPGDTQPEVEHVPLP